MNRRNFVCMDCRKAIRSDHRYGNVTCSCGTTMKRLEQLPVPAKDDKRGWIELENHFRNGGR